MVEHFPNLFGEDPTPVDSVSHDEVALAIQVLTRMSAACALAGDMRAGRAFMGASTGLIEFAIERWPTYKAPDFAATKQEVEAAANASTATQEATMEEKDKDTNQSDSGTAQQSQTTGNAREGTDANDPNRGDGSGMIQDTQVADENEEKLPDAESEVEADADADAAAEVEQQGE